MRGTTSFQQDITKWTEAEERVFVSLFDKSLYINCLPFWRLSSQTVTSIRQYRMTLEAFSEDHLKTLYFNPLLEQMEDFVEHFIKV